MGGQSENVECVPRVKISFHCDGRLKHIVRYKPWSDNWAQELGQSSDKV